MAQVSDYVNVIIRGDSTKLVSSIRNAARSMRRLAVGAQQVGMAFAALSAVATTAVKNVMTVTVSLDDALRKMAGKMGANFDGEEFRGIIKDIEELGSVLPVTTTQVAQVGVTLAQMGERGRDNLKNLMEMSIKLARALDIEAAPAAELLLKTMKQFNIPDAVGDKAKFVANQITFLSNNSAADAESIAEAYKMIGSASGELGLSLIDVNKMLAVASEVNLEGSQAGRTGVTAMINMFTNPKAQDAMKQWGVNLREITASGGGIVEVSRQMKAALDAVGATTEQRAAAWNDLFGKVGMKFGLALSGAPQEAIDAWESRALRAVDTVDRAFNTMEGGIGGQLRLLQSAWEAFRISVGRGMQKYVAVMSAGLTDQLLIAKAWIDSNPSIAVDLLATAVMSVVAAVGLLGTAMAAIAFASFLSSIGGILSMLLSLSPVIAGLIALVLLIPDSMYEAAGSAKSFNDVWSGLEDGFETFRDAIHNAMLMISQGDWDMAFKQITSATIVFVDEMIKALTPLAEWAAEQPFIKEIIAIGGLINRGRSVSVGASREMMTAGHEASARARFMRLGQSGAPRQAYYNWDDLGSFKDVGKEVAEAMDRGEDGVEAFNSAMERARRAQERYISEGYAMEKSANGWDKVAEAARANIDVGNEYTKTLLEMKEARKGLTDEERKTLGEEQAAKLKKFYGEAAAEAHRLQMAEEERLNIIKRGERATDIKMGALSLFKSFEKAHLNPWLESKGFKKHFDIFNPGGGFFSWSNDAAKAKGIIETISYGKIGDFDSNTAMAKMNTKLNETAEKQLRELQEHTTILEVIKNNTGNALKVGI